jgi:phosphonopyruvate decarboxylase
MINPKSFYDHLSSHSDFITGVPDSLLKEFNACVLDEHPKNKHIIAPNEGTSIGLAIGNYISTGKVPTVYMQNSGIGNAVNPLMSLADKDVYGVPMLVIIGWRGEPGVKDEPQHFKQGLIQEDLLKAMQLDYSILDSENQHWSVQLDDLYSSAVTDQSPKVLLVRKGTFDSYKSSTGEQLDLESRESAINTVLDGLGRDSIFIGTTGKASRELFELRVVRGESHENDFLTVGGMGHASAIATGISMNTTKRVVCLDGDGALLMHMGGLVSTAHYTSSNFVHVVINNGVHESVGGQPTLINNVDVKGLAIASGYKNAHSVKTAAEFHQICDSDALGNGSVLIEYRVKPGARKDLGRPTQSPKENLKQLMSVVCK